MPLFVSPTRPSIAPNVTSSSISPVNYSLAAGQTLYSTTLEILFDAYFYDRTASFSNAGTMWADYSGQVYVLQAMYADALVNSGTIVAHSTGAAVQTILVGGLLSTGIRNSGSIYALSDTSGAYAVVTWDSQPLINSGIIAARGQISAFAIIAQNSTQIVNQVGGSILAEADSAVAISIARGNFVQWGFTPTTVGIENHGRIEALSTDASRASIAISVSTSNVDAMVVENFGTIRADIAYAGGDWNSTTSQHGTDILTNRAGATIEGAILLALGNDVINNAGQINGYIDMGEDADLFDNRMGQHVGGADMGWGDDRFLGGTGVDSVTGGRDDDYLSGGGGNDLLLGGWGDDRLEGNAGNDGLYGEGGNDILLAGGGDWLDAGEGDDRVDLADYQFARAIGGTGNDTLVLPSDGRILDLGLVVGSGRVSGFEAIQLAANGRLVVHAADVITLSDNDILRVISDGAAIVDLAGSWSATGSQTLGGMTYAAYSSGAAQLLVAQGLTINFNSQPAGALGLDAIAAGVAAPTPGSTVGVNLSSTTTVTNGEYLTSSLEIASSETWTTTDSIVLTGYDTNPLTVLNHGLITATGGQRTFTAAVSGRIDFLINDGTISATRLSGTAELAANRNALATYGINNMVINGLNNAYGARPQGSLSNSGLISAATDQGIAVAVLNTFNNSGTFSATSTAFVALGAWAANGGLLINSGTIEAVGAWGAYGVGSSTHAMTLINSGTIRADATDAGRNGIAIDIYYALGFQRITNSGTILSDVAIRTLGMVNGGNVWLDNSGQISGRIELNLPFTPGQFIPVRDDIIVNRGFINGTIALGTGRDIYDGTHGTQTGTVFGEDGADLLIGTAGANTLDGGAGDDVLFARGGDRLTGGSGADLFVFSAVTPGAPPEIITDFVSGSDRIDLRAITPSSVTINASTISAVTASGTLTIQVTGSVLMSDIITGATTDMTGTSGDDVLVAGPAGATLSGGDGRDLLVGGAGNDQLDGGATPPLFTAEYGDIMWGGAGNDTYVVDAEHDLVVEDLAGGYDTIEITTGIYNFIYQMPAHVERVVGGSAYGNSLDNVMIGSSGIDLLSGGDGADSVTGGGGADNLAGGAGNDTLNGGTGADVLDGGAGNDRIYYDAADSAAQVTGGTGTDILMVTGAAVPTGFNLTAQGFESAEATQTDTGANPWSSIVSTYNANWAMLQQNTFNDNGSRVQVDLDPNNLVNTSQVWSSFDAQNRLSTLDQIFDNGTRTFINADEANNQPFTQDWFNYDAQGRLDSQDVLYDNGTRTFINFDQAGTQDFAQNWFAYDAQGRLDYQDVYYDNGSRTFIQFDQDSSQSWNQAWFTYDAQGRLDTQDVLNDDGSHTFYNYDQAMTETFAVVALLYNSGGMLTQQVIAWDDGSYTYTYF